MVPVRCHTCKAQGMVWDPGWKHDIGPEGYTRDFCPSCPLPEREVERVEHGVRLQPMVYGNVVGTIPIPTTRELSDEELDEKSLRAELDAIEKRFLKEVHDLLRLYEILHPLQKRFGFTVPEDGSEERYLQRRVKYDVPWGRHTLYWLLRNCVAHPLIGVFPIATFFRFHDWTSRKMHGK